jgi:ectoine hydroxylase-related dioxygenase (phytanoyl-CoA dioxygenase family)
VIPATVTGPDLAASFAERGFVLVPDLLSAAEIERFGAAVDAAVAARTAHDQRSLDQKTRYERSFQQCLNLWEDHPDVRALTFHSRIAETAARLLGVVRLRVWHDQALYKQAGGRRTDAHQDQPYWPIEETDTVTAWIPFQDVDRAMGAVGYVPGSHRFGVRRFANIFSGSGFDLEHGEEARGVAPEFVEVPAGAVTFHHGLTIHAAAPNTSDRTRRVHTVIYFADGSHRIRRAHPHPSVDRAGIEPGALIASSATPIAWPAPASLPDPPPRLAPPSPGWAGWPGGSR